MIRFDDAAAIAYLRLHLITAMKRLQDEFLRESQQGMRTAEGANSLHEGDVTEAAGIIAAEIAGGAWAAMDEWGTGSLMDTSGPGFEVYRNSDLWNPTRGKHGPNDTAIRTRPEGPYTDIFGEIRQGRGKGGLNLEALGKVEPQPPSHAMTTAARWMANGRMQKVLQDALQSFPWGRFLVVDGR